MNINIKTKHILIIFIVSLLYFLPGIISPRDFWVEDEARYCEILREMVHDGQWAVPHLNGHYYPDKPPTYFWLCAISSPIKIIGVPNERRLITIIFFIC